MTMSHPEGISEKFGRRISGMRRLMGWRTPGPPTFFFTLIPRRLCPRPLARAKAANCALARRRPPRYTASNSARRSSRTARGKRCGAPAPPGGTRAELDWREAITALLAARPQHFASALALHARAGPVGLVTAVHFGLEGAFRQRQLPL